MPLQDLSVGSTSSSSSNTSGLGSRQSEPTPEKTSWWDNFTSAFTGSGGDDSNISNPEEPVNALPRVTFDDDNSSSAADIYDQPEFTYEPEVYAAIADAGTANVFYTPDDIIQEAYDADMAGKGEDKPDPLGNMGVPPTTLEDVTGTDAGALSNPQPLYDMADEFANPTITTTPLDQEAALRDALMQGQPSGLMSRPSSFTGEGVQVAQANIPNWMTDMSGSELADVLAGIREGTHDAETGERIEDVSPAQEAPDQVAPTEAVEPVEAVNAFDDEVKTLIEKNEGNKNLPYKDTEGYWTVGIGHFIGETLPDEYKDENGNPKPISNAKVQELFKADYAKHKAEAEDLPHYDALDDKGKSVLIDLSFNMGGDKFNEDKWPGFFSALADRDVQRAADELVDSRWYRQTKSRGKRMVKRMRQARFN